MQSSKQVDGLNIKVTIGIHATEAGIVIDTLMKKIKMLEKRQKKYQDLSIPKNKERLAEAMEHSRIMKELLWAFIQ